MAEEINKIGIHELLEKIDLSDNDIFVIQDEENTKRISFRHLRENLIDDDELESTHRVYSSAKTGEVIRENIGALNDTIGNVNEKMDVILENSITVKQVEEKLEDFSKQVPNLADIDEIKLSLKAKRNVSDKITCDDIETGEDEKKIQPENLSANVLNMMTGRAPVTPPSAPAGGWTQEYIATNAINGKKLSRQYRFKGHFPDGNINNFTSDGIYLLGASVEGLPKYDENEPDQDRLLEVYNYGPDQYIIQRIYYCLEDEDSIKPVYERRALLSTLHVSKFVANYPVTDTFKITRSILDDNVFNMGQITTGDLFKITIDGNYFVNRKVKNLPNDKHDYMVSVTSYENYIEYHAKSIEKEGCEIYICKTYLSGGARIAIPWAMTNTITKSKFQDKRIHLFGDGVCFGMGSSDYMKYAYPALLNSRYGIDIITTNHAQGDATIGNYGDSYLSERSVLTQINNTEFNDDDIIIIFAGSNDYKLGRGKIGLNTDMNDFTFKGSLNMCIYNILQMNSNAKILVISPLFRARLDASDSRNSDDTPINELYLRDYVTAMKEVCKYNHVPFLDLHSTSMINQYNYKKYLTDRLYLNDNGHSMIADRIFSALNYFY